MSEFLGYQKGQSVELLVENLILNQLQPPRLSKFFTVERAHRDPSCPPRPGNPPRTIVARTFNLRDRDAILQMARVKGDFPYENSVIRFFPDFTLQCRNREGALTT